MLNFNKKSTPINTDKIDTLIGKNTSINGDLKAEGTIRIDGTVQGDVTISGNLILGEQGLIKGNVKADSVHLSGVIEGNATSVNQLYMTSTGRLNGDMNVSNIIIDEGAIFQGNCSMGALEAAAAKVGTNEDKNNKEKNKGTK